MWKQVNAAAGLVAFSIPPTVGVLNHWAARDESSAWVSMWLYLLVAPLPLVGWWLHLRRPAPSIRGTLILAAGVIGLTLATTGFWAAAVGWRTVAAVGIVSVLSECVRVASLGSSCASQQPAPSLMNPLSRWRFVNAALLLAIAAGVVAAALTTQTAGLLVAVTLLPLAGSEVLRRAAARELEAAERIEVEVTNP